MTVEVPPSPTFATKTDLYAWLLQQTAALVDGLSVKFTPQANLLIGLTNVAALCFYTINRHANPAATLDGLVVNWFGFYLRQTPAVLGLGPFQGRPACTEIRLGRGVCGEAAATGTALVVEDVHAFPGHIACDSASAAEVVVPLRLSNGSVVGVIDVDSTVAGFFDEEDRAGLEAVAAVLVQHLEFPMSRVLAANPALGVEGFSALAGGDPVSRERLRNEAAAGAAEAAAAHAGRSETAPPPPTTRVTGIPHFRVELAAAETTTKSVAGWQFAMTRLDRIMTQEEQDEVQRRLSISALPEISFQHNSLEVAMEASRKHPWLRFNLEGLMASASLFYRTEAYRDVVEPQLRIPVSEGWESSKYEKYDPNVDWCWRNDYYGIVSTAVRVVPRPDDLPDINWELLKDNTRQIVFFDSFDMMEDDLHDHGIVSSSVKFRVMKDAFFILHRHSIRIDGYAIWMRDIRIFHEFAITRGASATPHVVVLEQIRRVQTEGRDDISWKDLSMDAVANECETVATRNLMLEPVE